MAANTSPIFARTPDVQVGGAVLGQAAATGFTIVQDGTGTLILIFAADAIEGSFVREVKLKPVGGSVAATVCRIYLCTATGAFTSGTTNTVANTAMIAEISLAATTTSNTAAQNDLSIPIMQAIPAGMKLLISFGTSTNASAGIGYAVSTWAGKY